MQKNIHRFKIAVNCASFSLDGTSEVQDRKQIYDDQGMIALPDSYSETGRGTRLVINCHGAGGTVTTDDSQVEQQMLTKYLLANGYAVMDVNGLPNDFAKIKGVDIRNNIGSPVAVQSYVKAYRYCIDRFNLKREAFIHGASMGGISSTNVVLSNCIPIIAQSGFCPVLDTYNQIFLRPWSKGLPKTALGELYHFERDASGDYIYDENKVCGFNPMGRLLRIGEKETLPYPVPVKFWQCEDDETVAIDSTKRFVSAIRNAGGIAYLRTFPKGGHEPQLCGEFLNDPSGNTVWADEVIQITPAVEEVFLWFKRFD